MLELLLECLIVLMLEWLAQLDLLNQSGNQTIRQSDLLNQSGNQTIRQSLNDKNADRYIDKVTIEKEPKTWKRKTTISAYALP